MLVEEIVAREDYSRIEDNSRWIVDVVEKNEDDWIEHAGKTKDGQAKAETRREARKRKTRDERDKTRVERRSNERRKQELTTQKRMARPQTKKRGQKTSEIERR